MNQNLETAKRYWAAIEQNVDSATLAAFFTDNVVQEEFPNRLTPSVARRDLAALLEGNERGKKVVQNQRYAITNALVNGDQVALEVIWTA